MMAPAFSALTGGRLETLQVNLGYRCNLNCAHCHVGAGPKRTETLERDTMETVIEFLRNSTVRTLDLTGGAPELNPHFCELVDRAVALGLHVIDRCNLTILEEPGQEDLAEFLADRRVEIAASMPCFLKENVDRQRGKGVFEASIRALRRLNALGYGQEGRGLALNLVYNPSGPVLPPGQQGLEADYKARLLEDHGVVFNELFVLANLPIGRFRDALVSTGRLGGYLQVLFEAHRDDNLDSVMCRSLLSVDWRGIVYDCDFNQMLEIPLGASFETVFDLESLAPLAGRPIATDWHCFGCTAGAGSTCGGAIQKTPN